MSRKHSVGQNLSKSILFCYLVGEISGTSGFKPTEIQSSKSEIPVDGLIDNSFWSTPIGKDAENNWYQVCSKAALTSITLFIPMNFQVPSLFA